MFWKVHEILNTLGLLRDFNARVCNKDDFVDADDFLRHHLSLDDSMDGSLNISLKLVKTNVS